MINVIPVNRSVLVLYLMLNAARNGATSIPAIDAAVTICPAFPTVVLYVNAMSARMKPISIPMGLVDSCEMKSAGMSNLFSVVGFSLINRSSVNEI